VKDTIEVCRTCDQPVCVECDEDGSACVEGGWHCSACGWRDCRDCVRQAVAEDGAR
jgi:hypothetical protein